jgi:hypothetical protein
MSPYLSFFLIITKNKIRKTTAAYDYNSMFVLTCLTIVSKSIYEPIYNLLSGV